MSAVLVDHSNAALLASGFPPIEDTTRREFITGVGAAALAAAFLVACGEDEGDRATATPEAGFPRTVAHGLGETVIPSMPQRIVATADRDQLEVLLAMGIKPVLYGFSGDYETSAPWVSPDLLTGLEQSSMPGAFEPNLEAIAAAKPDLILDAWADEDMYQRLSAIAPTVEIKVESTTTWQEAQRLAGAATGHEDAAEAAIADTEAEIARQAARLAAYTELAVAIAFQDSGELVMIPGNEIGGRIVTELGMTVLAPTGGTSGRFSLEQMGELLGDADIVLSLDYGSLDDQEANPLFRQLPAVREGRYVTISSDLASACYQESTLSLRWAAGPVADALLEAAEGRGKQLG
jgi:iron complex transport system substrate-binding protein